MNGTRQVQYSIGTGTDKLLCRGEGREVNAIPNTKTSYHPESQPNEAK